MIADFCFHVMEGKWNLINRCKRASSTTEVDVGGREYNSHYVIVWYFWFIDFLIKWYIEYASKVHMNSNEAGSTRETLLKEPTFSS